MAKLKYNDLELSNVKILSFATVNEFESDNFNRTGRKHTMQGIGILRGAFATTLASVKETLTRPGRKIEIQFEDQSGAGTWTTLANGADALVDSKNGPLPEISVTEIAGNNATAAFLVSFTFNWFECGSTGIQRFEQVTTHTINAEGAVTITRRGFIRVSAANSVPTTFVTQQSASTNSFNPYGNPLNPTGGLASTNLPNNADLYRRLIAGDIPNNYQRTRENYYVSADQLTLAFEIEDTQLNQYIPTPAYDGDGSFDYERGISDSNFQGTKRFRIELVGRPGRNMNDLFMSCVDVALTRIRFLPPYPDIIQSFKISEPSLLKQNKVGLEIVALGTPTAAKFEPQGSTDEWLYYVLFARPTDTGQQFIERDPYGTENQRGFKSIAPKFRFDPCTSIDSWSYYVPTIRDNAVNVVTEETPTPQPLESSNGNKITKPADNKPDPQLDEDAKKVVHYESSQYIDEETNNNFIMPMGWGIQYGFQFALPEVVIHQEVDMITRDATMPIPWPKCGEAFVVLKKKTVINDAPPDASGNRLFAIHAERDIKVSVWNSPNTFSPSSGIPFAANGDGQPSGTLTRVVWSPTSIPTGRHPVTGNNRMDLRENKDGTVQRQDYIGNDYESGDVAEG